MLVLIVFYGLAFVLFPTLSHRTSLVLHFVHALAWCLIHYFGLGLLLREQSDNKFFVRHYLKHYHYDYAQSDRGQNAIIEAFSNWKTIYNLSMCMTYGLFHLPLIPPSTGRMINLVLELIVSCIGVAWKAYSLPNNWTVGNELLRHTLGLVSAFKKSMQQPIDLINLSAFNCATCMGYDGVLRGPWSLW